MYQANFEFNNHSQYLFYCTLLLSLFFVTGCSSTTPIKITHTEHIPPITEEGRNCISIIMAEYRLCTEGAKLETTVCQDEAYGLAQRNHALALEGHALQISKQKKQQADQDQQRKMHIAQEEKEYSKCLDRRKMRDAKAAQSYNLWRANGSIGSPPFIQEINCSTPLPYLSNQNNYTAVIKKPVLKEFIEDAHCFSNYYSCTKTYDRNYIDCAGTIIKTTRCFENCNK